MLINKFVQIMSWNVLILPVRRGYQVKQSCPGGANRHDLQAPSTLPKKPKRSD